ncbi:TPA: hypothetical protein ACS3A4_003128 [Klebsiella pneumoniae]
MTDITELARERLKEKFDAWWEREYKHLESSNIPMQCRISNTVSGWHIRPVALSW